MDKKTIINSILILVTFSPIGLNAQELGIKASPELSYSLFESSKNSFNNFRLPNIGFKAPAANYSTQDLSNGISEGIGGFCTGVLYLLPPVLLGVGLAFAGSQTNTDDDMLMGVILLPIVLSPLCVPLGVAKGINYVGERIPHGGSYRRALVGSFLGLVPGLIYGGIAGKTLSDAYEAPAGWVLATSITVGMIPVTTGGVIGYNLESVSSIFNKNTLIGALIGGAAGLSLGALASSNYFLGGTLGGALTGCSVGVIAGSIIGYNINF